VNVIDQDITHHIKFNPDYVQTCSCIGNLHTESAMVHSTASGERRKDCVIHEVICHHPKFNPDV